MHQLKNKNRQIQLFKLSFIAAPQKRRQKEENGGELRLDNTCEVSLNNDFRSWMLQRTAPTLTELPTVGLMKNEILSSLEIALGLHPISQQGQWEEAAGGSPRVPRGIWLLLSRSLPWIIQKEALTERCLRSPQPQPSPGDTLTHFTQGEKPSKRLSSLCVHSPCLPFPALL